MARLCPPLSKAPDNWKQGAKGLWTCRGCNRTGLQVRHQHRSYPNPVKIPVYGDWRGARSTRIGFALVSPIDSYLQQWKWRVNKDGYVYRKGWAIVHGVLKRTNLKIHRVILGLESGNPLEGHHRDDDPLNNQRWNLEAVTRSVNELHKHRRNLRVRNLAGEVIDYKKPRQF